MTLEFPSLPDARWLRSFRRRLLAWYGRHARQLPWRRNRDPYAVWVSEIMLQQTQVGTVTDYFDRFLERFPAIESLAVADEHDVLRLWEGLGYYRRARQLHRAAKILLAEHRGQFPRDPEAVRKLPGVGRYTAGAILSIAFDAREPILEANTLRLFSRLLAFEGDPRNTEGQQLLWAMAESVLPRRGAGRLNQALMELGATVCVNRTPSCDDCPVAMLCRANRQGCQSKIPRSKPKPPLEAVREASVLVRRGPKVLLLRWPEGHRWAGLWDFPRFPICAEPPAALHRELVKNVLALTGVAIVPQALVKTLTHGVTRFRITLDCYEAECLPGQTALRGKTETRWVKPAELETYPLSSTGRRLARWLQEGNRPIGDGKPSAPASIPCRVKPVEPRSCHTSQPR